MFNGPMSSAAPNIPSVGAAPRSLVGLQSVLATRDVAQGPLLHLLHTLTGVLHLLVAELALHDGLHGCRLIPTWSRRWGS